ncbi:MAG: zinc-ribbon domain-containing protein, partial [Desulfomonile tiedjei]|nr:zinc-ribbon domain-containing protein [Desulfomonile tiedjei]
MRRLSGDRADGSSFCPQCGAQVSKKMLTCPECGHVIPGQDRWAEAEPKTGLLQRLSPKTIGCILAFPVAVVLFFFFKNIIVPMAETVGDKRAQAVRKEIPKGKTPMEAAKDMAKELSTRTISAEVTRYIEDEILTSAKVDFSSFTVGPKWEQLTAQERELFVREISLAMEGSNLKKDFRLVSPSGHTIAKVVDGTAIWKDGTDLVLPHSPRPTEET